MSAQTETLLVELFTEELPPRALQKLGDAFASAIHSGLITRGLTTTDVIVEMFATPRRLAVRIGHVSAVAADRAESKKLMPAKVAFDAAGNATPALQKRLEKESASLVDTVRKVEGNEEVVYLSLLMKGATLQEGLQAALTDAISKLPIPKVMTYQLADGLSSVQFVRPAHGLVAMHGEQVIAVTALGSATKAKPATPAASCSSTTACTWTSRSTAAPPSAKPTRPASATWCWKPRSQPSWTWKTRSPWSMRTTKSWPIATGWAF